MGEVLEVGKQLWKKLSDILLGVEIWIKAEILTLNAFNEITLPKIQFQNKNPQMQNGFFGGGGGGGVVYWIDFNAILQHLCSNGRRCETGRLAFEAEGEDAIRGALVHLGH